MRAQAGARKHESKRASAAQRTRVTPLSKTGNAQVTACVAARTRVRASSSTQTRVCECAARATRARAAQRRRVQSRRHMTSSYLRPRRRAEGAWCPAGPAGLDVADLANGRQGQLSTRVLREPHRARLTRHEPRAPRLGTAHRLRCACKRALRTSPNAPRSAEPHLRDDPFRSRAVNLPAVR